MFAENGASIHDSTNQGVVIGGIHFILQTTNQSSGMLDVPVVATSARRAYRILASWRGKDPGERDRARAREHRDKDGRRLLVNLTRAGQQKDAPNAIAISPRDAGTLDARERETLVALPSKLL
jgi:hypothetical protein